MCDKDAGDRPSNCSCPCKKLQKCYSHEAIIDEPSSIENLAPSRRVLKSCDKGQAYLKASLSRVMQTMLVSLEGSEAHFIFLSSQGDSPDELNILHFLISLASDTAYLEEIAKGFDNYPGDGNLMNNVGVMLTRRVKYNLSEKCFLRTLHYFRDKEDHLGIAVVTVNLAVFHMICGDFKKAQSYCNDAVELCLVITKAPPADVHLLWKVVFRLNLLCQKLKNYKSFHEILRVAVKFDVCGISDAFALKYMKQLMTLQLKEHEGEKNKHEELEEFALQLFAADAFMKTQPLTADFITTVMTLAEMYCTIKCLKEARQLIDKLEATFLHVYGGNGPFFGFLQYQIGHFKVKYCEASEAQSALQKAEEIFIRYFGRGYHMVGSCKSVLGTCALHKGNLKEVHHHLKEACILFEKLNHHHPEVGEILLKLADLEGRAGNFENAKLIIEEALEIFISACGKVSLQTASAYLQGASILKRKEKFMRSALDKVKKANDIFVHHGLHHDHPDVAFCHYLRGQLLHSLGQVKEAEEEFLFVHHQLSSRDDLSMKTKVIAPELYRMFFVVDADGLALRGSCCSHFLSLVSLADMKTGDEKRGHIKEIFNCLEELDSTVLTVSDYLGKYVHCTLQRTLEANVQVYFTLILNSATSLGEDESFSSKYSGKEKKQPGDYDNVYLLSSCSNNGKGPQFLLFWKTSDVLETGDISCVTSSFRESVKLLCLQPKFRKTFLEGQELFMKLPTQEQSPSVSSLSSQIDSLPLLVELELSKSHNLCDSIDSFPTASAVWPLAHVSYFSYRFSSSDKALLVFYKWFSSLGRKLELSEVRSISTPEVSPSQRNCVVHFTFIDPICASLSLAVEDGSVLVKCRTVKESGSTCICSSVRSALESTAEAWESDVVGSVLEQSLWLPCVEDGADYGKKRTKCYSGCKDSQMESSSFSDQKLDIRPQTNWEQDSDILKKEPSVDLSQNEDTECPSFTAHPDDTLGTDVCVQLLECILRNRQLSLDKQLSGINNQLHTTDGTEEHVNSLLLPVSSSSLNCLPSSQYDATNEKPEFKPEAFPCLEDVIEETCAGKETGNVSDTPSTSQAVFFNSHYSESAAEKSNCEEGLIADNHPSPETKENLLPNVIPQEAFSVKGVGTCFHKEESREDQGIEIDQSPGPSFTTVGRENDRGTVAINGLVCELQGEVAFYQDQCRKLREEVVELKEKWKLSEDEKQDLQAEVGRQLFLESKEKRSIKIYQPPSEHASRTSMPGRVRGASHDFSVMGAKLLGGAGPLNNSGFLFQQRLQEISNSLSELELSRIKSLVRPLLDCLRLARIREGSELFEELERKGELSCSFVRDLLRRIHRFDLVEKLAVPFHNGDESYRGESYLSQEKNQQNEGSESVSGVDGKQADEVEEWNDIFDNTEDDGEVQFSNSSNINPFNSDSEVAAITFHAEIINESSFVDMDLSKERCDSASSLSQSFDVPSIGVVSEERSQSLSVTGEQFESGELKGACGAGNERGREGSNESSLHDGAEQQFNFNHHFNDIVDGAVNLPDRAQHSLMLEDFTGENQDSLPYGDTTQRQNVSGARITVK
ncbi:uncharacterized protein LOC111330733 [Stylophora pistillata]|uniref:uncharacterized protein LOC111330733 n=1 Tax=Stylophora pistillata TaxID=50429 RepID=UPI000C04DB80|nr:uncharacterized protein LOC111330733 [Stylophora pistillata]XP_022791385.1 uncharacterized protein LOC111330733 [Stylophora pistillata]XP_022791386.1 uncharacterized protein LOC111330733 [Stylophora pistillata]